ncbi:ankyrin repeat-containing protein ITN1-like isoform X1 [Lycium barbarum]|uniref:ankyrin repeat-containing protein ITN1-like isoform X1 n=1 Tax=Lycium barbarum TaxID=112863 RepID=UPI00293EF163|nr:ankyrin repeat-containing protein ITN1-like isoform X1 [Lycium barbarum]XP_060190225.1 ankyrin repeat-containing protein ITN1-like isoform X1 [Lycium barbarum]
MDTEKRLYEAAVEGDVRALQELLQQDALILDRLTLTCFNETPLHIAAMRGHIEFVRLILAHNPHLAAELDSRKSSALHLASAKGHLQIVKMLLVVNPEMCLACDRDGRNPLHLAAIKGRVEVIKELIHIRPHAALGTTINGENVLHLCVKHNQLEVLKVLMEIGWDHEFLNAKDGDGHAILLLAVADKQIETAKYLLKNNQIDVNAMDANGNTALDILAQSRRDMNDLSIGECLREAGGLRAKDISVSIIQNSTKISNDTGGNNHSQVSSTPAYLGENQAKKPPSKGDWLSKKRETIMVVASLIATMAFQAGVNPPGGVWQENGKLNDQGIPSHKAGEAVMAYNHAKAYRCFLRANTIAFVSSLSTILLLISGLPFRLRLFMWGLMAIMWLTVTSAALTYGISIYILTPKKDSVALGEVIEIGITVWCGLMALLLLGNTIRLLRIWQKKKHGIRSSSSLKSANSINYVNV